MIHKLRRALIPSLAILSIGALVFQIVAQEYTSGKKWADPRVVTPGDGGSPPSDAVVLFDGKDLSEFEGGNWVVKDGVAMAGDGDTHTKRSFGDYQLHLEFATPAKVEGDGQGRGNSGVYLASRYEVQILDSFNNPTYPDGACAAIYKQWPPLVNACRKPGEWQTYDIVFQAPRFDGEKLVTSGYVTVLQNGVLVQNHAEILGNTAWSKGPAYEPHPVKQPILLQYHNNPVRFRNIWVRELAGPAVAP